MGNGPEIENKPAIPLNDILRSEARPSSQTLIAQNRGKVAANNINELETGPGLKLKRPKIEPGSAKQKFKPRTKPTEKIIKKETPKGFGARVVELVVGGIKDLTNAPLDEKVTASLGAVAGYAIGSSAAAVLSVPAAPLLVGVVGALMFSLGSREALKFTKYSLENMKKFGKWLINDLKDQTDNEPTRMKEKSNPRDGNPGPTVPDSKPQNEDPDAPIYLTDIDKIA